MLQCLWASAGKTFRLLLGNLFLSFFGSVDDLLFFTSMFLGVGLFSATVPSAWWIFSFWRPMMFNSGKLFWNLKKFPPFHWCVFLWTSNFLIYPSQVFSFNWLFDLLLGNFDKFPEFYLYSILKFPIFNYWEFFFKYVQFLRSPCLWISSFISLRPLMVLLCFYFFPPCIMFKFLLLVLFSVFHMRWL